MKSLTIQLSLFLSCCLLFSCKQKMYRQSSGAMEGTLMTGQQFLVSITDSFQRNDIVVFDCYGPDYTSYDRNTGYKMHWEKRVFRLIAESGDIVQIRNGELYVNKRIIAPPPKAKLEYEVRATTSITELDDENLYNTRSEMRGDTIYYWTQLTSEEAEEYRRRQPAIQSVERKLISQPPYPDTMIAKTSAGANWTLDDYGPLKIPAPGETITVDAGNFKLYQNIPGIEMGQYVIKEKIYFLLGDNRYGAADSRYIGLISHSKMHGIVQE